MWYQYKAYDVFSLSISVCLNIANFDTAYLTEFHSSSRSATCESNLRFPRPALSCCIAIGTHSIIACRYNVRNYVSFPAGCASRFHLGTEKNCIYTLFRHENNYTYSITRFWKRKGWWMTYFLCLGRRSLDVMNDIIALSAKIRVTDMFVNIGRLHTAIGSTTSGFYFQT